MDFDFGLGFVGFDHDDCIGVVHLDEDNVELLELSLGDEVPYDGDQPSPDGYVCPQRRRSRRGLQKEGLPLIS